MVWPDLRNRMLLAISDVVLEIVMNKVGSSKCMAKSTFYRKKSGRME